MCFVYVLMLCVVVIFVGHVRTEFSSYGVFRIRLGGSKTIIAGVFYN